MFHTHTPFCCSTARSLALGHILMLACGALSCTSTHTCHARLVYVLLHSHSYVSYTTVRSLARPHVLLLSYFQFSCTCTHATLLRGLLHLHTYVMLRCCTFSCTSTQTTCYAPVCSLAFPRRRHARLLYVLLHFHTHFFNKDLSTPRVQIC